MNEKALSARVDVYENVNEWVVRLQEIWAREYLV
jgi:hypothetical protein